MFTTTARQLIADSLTLIGAKAVGTTLTYDEEQDAYRQLQSLIDTWGVQPGTMFTVTRTTGTLTANVATFTIGTSGDFNVPRPALADIRGAAYLNPGVSPDTETQIPVLTEQAYQALPQKALTSTLPTAVYYNPTAPAATGLGTLKPWPVQTQNVTLVLYLATAVAQFADLTTSTILPPGMFQALKYTLAVQVAPEYGVLVVPSIEAEAREAVRIYKRGNTTMRTMASSWGAPGQYDINSDVVIR